MELNKIQMIGHQEKKWEREKKRKKERVEKRRCRVKNVLVNS